MARIVHRFALLHHDAAHLMESSRSGNVFYVDFKKFTQTTNAPQDAQETKPGVVHLVCVEPDTSESTEPAGSSTVVQINPSMDFNAFVCQVFKESIQSAETSPVLPIKYSMALTAFASRDTKE